mgnify:FL=1
MVIGFNLASIALVYFILVFKIVCHVIGVSLAAKWHALGNFHMVTFSSYLHKDNDKKAPLPLISQCLTIMP